MSGSLVRLSEIKEFWLFFTKKLRLSNPWNFKVPFLMSIPYLLFLLSDYKEDKSIWAILASLSVIVGIAGIGYLTNDLGDKQKDQLIKKENVTAQISRTELFFLFFIFLFFAIGPWFYLPMNRWSLILFILQFVLFYSYAFPPFRFKERGFLGVMIDALYAHLNPAILAAYTFYLFAGKTYPQFCSFLLVLGSWQFFLGLRNIIFHQLKDFEGDALSGTKTFVINYGKVKSEHLLKRFLLPFELISFISLCVFLSKALPFLIPFMLFYWFVTFLKIRTQFKDKGFRELAYTFLDDLYIQWIPFVILLGLVIHSSQFIPILILHFSIFRNKLKTGLIIFLSKISSRKTG